MYENQFTKPTTNPARTHITSPPATQQGRTQREGLAQDESVLYVGIDIAAYSHCMRATNTAGATTSHFNFANTRQGFEQAVEQSLAWQRSLGCSRLQVAMEPTAEYWKPLWHYLGQHDISTVLVPSLAVKRSKDLRDNTPSKSDPKDALLIANLQREGIVLRYEEAAENECLRELVHLKEDLDKTVTAYVNRFQGIVGTVFPEMSQEFDSVWCTTARAVLGAYPTPQQLAAAPRSEVEALAWKVSRGRVGSGAVRRLQEAAGSSIGVPPTPEGLWVFEKVLELVEVLVSMRDEVVHRLKECVSHHPHAEYLGSIPGMGIGGVSTILAALGDLRRYPNVRAVWKKAGLNLYRLSSGTYRGRDRISKRGPGYLRRVLYMVALQQTNPGGFLYDFYQRLVKRDRCSKKALVGVMRKLLAVGYALVRDGRCFEVAYAAGVRSGNRRVMGRVSAA